MVVVCPTPFYAIALSNVWWTRWHSSLYWGTCFSTHSTAWGAYDCRWWWWWWWWWPLHLWGCSRQNVSPSWWATRWCRWFSWLIIHNTDATFKDNNFFPMDPRGFLLPTMTMMLYNPTLHGYQLMWSRKLLTELHNMQGCLSILFSSNITSPLTQLWMWCGETSLSPQIPCTQTLLLLMVGKPMHRSSLALRHLPLMSMAWNLPHSLISQHSILCIISPHSLWQHHWLWCPYKAH